MILKKRSHSSFLTEFTAGIHLLNSIHLYAPLKFLVCIGTDIHFCQSLKVRFSAVSGEYVGIEFHGKNLSC
jgi:hypothetical protein